ncbi:hypothetical protein PGB90_009863 [Kerria lacca]
MNITDINLYAEKPFHHVNDNTSLSLNEYVPIWNRLETYIVPIIFSIIFLIGVLGNGTLILIFVRHRTMRNVPNTYIISLALGDLLLILTCVPFTSTVYTFESWPYGVVICKISEATKDISIGVSVFTLTALSAERYCAISNPIRRRISSKPFTFIIAVSIWLLAGILALPSAFLSYLKKSNTTNNVEIEYCYPFPDELGKKYREGMVLFKFLAYYAVPLCIISCFYILMAKHLEMTTRNMPGELQGGQSSQIRARKKVAKMVLSFVIMFMICFLPHHIFMLWFHFYPNSSDDFDDFWNTFRITAFCLSFINSCINPIALYFISGVFRKYFNRYLFGCCRNSPINLDNLSTRGNSMSCRRLNSVVTHQFTITNTENS